MSSYKQRIKASLAKNQEVTRKATATFLDKTASKKVRLKAFTVSGTFNYEEDITKALAIFKDQAEDPEIRGAALLGLTSFIAGNEKMMDELLQLLQKEDTPVVIQQAILTVLQSNTFSSPMLNAKKAEYSNALRSVVEASISADVKRRAAEYLALDKDEYIQQKLLHGLETPSDEIVKPEVAIQLLSYDLHSEVYPTLRKIVANPPSQRAKKEALRNLASDPSSAGLLLKTLNDKNEDKEIRHVCAVGLQHIQPELLQNSLKSILTDKKENTELQVALLNTLNYTENTEVTDNDRQFQLKLESFAKNTTSTKLKKTYKSYINNKSRNNF